MARRTQILALGLYVRCPWLKVIDPAAKEIIKNSESCSGVEMPQTKHLEMGHYL